MKNQDPQEKTKVKLKTQDLGKNPRSGKTDEQYNERTLSASSSNSDRRTSHAPSYTKTKKHVGTAMNVR